MIVTGCVVIDLTKVAEKSQRGRVAAALGDAPNGADVEVHVGPLIVDPGALRVVRQYAEERGLSIHVKGEARAVQAWVLALRSGELLGMLL